MLWLLSHLDLPRGESAGAAENISKKEHPHRDLSTELRFGRDDKGVGGASRESSFRTGFAATSIWQLFSIEAPLSPLSSRPKRTPDFLLRGSRQEHGCGFP
jgi:hypothetical protein